MDDFKKILNQTQDKLAETISTAIRDINDKEKIVDFLKQMDTQPTLDILKRINQIAIEKEDYETCETLKEYSNQKV